VITKAKAAWLLAFALLVTGLVSAQTTATYTPGEFQSSNPFYPKPNPFYFEGKIDWNLLGITTPANTWEYMQRGIHKQDDLGDTAGAIQDYQTSYSMNSLSNNTCQIVTSASFVNGALPGTLTPPPCMFTVRLRLAHLLQETNPDQAVSLLKEVTQIDPLRLDVNALIGETYVTKAKQETDPTAQQNDYTQAISFLQAELALSPVTSVVTAQTGDTANNAHVHWDLAEIYETLGNAALEKQELNLYLAATQWHSDTYPWRITLAKQKLTTLQARH
jgi:tetratricopeptide (TPR) repeat protein